MTSEEGSSGRDFLRKEYILLFGLFVAALLFRTIFLGNTFQSADNVALADRVVHYCGYAWMAREYYGFLINFLVKIFTATLSTLGITLTEFWWKFPIALVGSVQVLVTYFILRKAVNFLAKPKLLAMAGAACLTFFPNHIMQSRYLWGYEVLGVFFLSLFLWSWLLFLEKPAPGSGRGASVLLALYLISHGYILPFFPAFCLSFFLLSSPEHRHLNPLKKFRANLVLFRHYRVWLYPLLFLPLTFGALRHTLQKKTQTGFYWSSLRSFIESVGIFFFVFILAAFFLFFLRKSWRHSIQWVFLLLGFSYLAPLFLAVPPGVTVVRGYMTMGIYWLLLFSLAVWVQVFEKKLRFYLWLLVFVLLPTALGTAVSIFTGNGFFNPTMIKADRGEVYPDPGTKAAGYILRRYFPADKYPASGFPILVLHRNIEPPCVSYYFEREAIAFYDLTLEQTRQAFLRYGEKASLVIAEADQVELVSSCHQFSPKIILYFRGLPRLWVFARHDVPLPEIKGEVEEFNRAYNREFAPRVSFR